MSRMTQSNYETGRVSECCAATGSPFAPDDHYVAALIVADDGETLERRDYTPDAWAVLPKPKGLFAHWQGIVPTSEKAVRPVIDTNELLGLFEQLGESVEPKQQAFRYVLALILMRKRVLMGAGSRDPRNGEPAKLLVRVRGSAPELPPLEVVDPAMDEGTVGEITEQLRVLLRLE